MDPGDAPSPPSTRADVTDAPSQLDATFLEARLAGLTAAVTRALVARKLRSIASDEGALRAAAEQLLAALASDFASGRALAQRAFLGRWVPAAIARGATLQELHTFSLTVRSALLDALAGERADGRVARRVEDWLHEMTYACALYFVAEREAAISQQAADLELRIAELAEAREVQARSLELLQQISIPIAPVHEGVLVVPLVGALDAARAALLMSRLLEAVQTSRSRYVLLDLSGVDDIDPTTAGQVLHLAQALRLLGAEMLLVGITTRVARSIIDLDLPISVLRTSTNLQRGLRQVLGEMSRSFVAADR